ncbi:uncharacterized protein LOC119276211 [Triticum dicoccoides]|uniref:uncharacterized protein LOC119276211 n=1 Tax=Triticum dicoccoides TaxID=85692 RepID=UPI00188F430D|nr:uncharacterized protein LOC119276211 [Triticum dicoccoides]
MALHFRPTPAMAHLSQLSKRPKSAPSYFTPTPYTLPPQPAVAAPRRQQEWAATTMSAKVRNQPCNWHAVCHLLPTAFSSCSDRPLQCEIGVQRAHYRRHCDLRRSGGLYTMEAEKGRKISQIGGDEWDCFIAYMHLTGSELISFFLSRQIPMMSVIYVNSEDEDDEDPFGKALNTQRMRLSEDESGSLWHILPPRDDYVEMPFVTRLTRTNVNRHVMVCYFV